jgi:thymidine kinase
MVFTPNLRILFKQADAYPLAGKVDGSGKAVAVGAQTEIGGNDRYVAMCRRHFSEALEGSLSMGSERAE